MSRNERLAVPVVVGAVIGRRGFLLIRREFEPFRGLWGLPGGKLRSGEQIPEAVERELLEETGLSARFVRFCGVVSESVFSGHRLRAHHLLLVCRLRANSDAVQGSDEGEVRWFSRRMIDRLGADMVPSDRLILSRLVLGKGRKRMFSSVLRRQRDSYKVDLFD